MDTTAQRIPKAAAIYCRISQDTQGIGLGVRRQEELCRELAEGKGWPVAEVYVDNDLSAFRRKTRPGYAQMLEDLEDGLRDAVIVVDQDRLTRHTWELEGFIDLADRMRVALATVSGDVDLSSSDGRFRARIMGAVDRQESEKKSERLKRQRAQAAKLGLPHGGRRAYGYKPDGVTIDPEEAKNLREAAERYLAGEALRVIARDWNERGIPTVSKRAGWHTTTMRSMLTNPRYAGLRVHQGEVVGEAVWKPIFDRATHERLRAAIGDPRKSKGGRPPANLLTSLLRCGICGDTMASSVRANGGRRYHCVKAPGRKGCGRISVNATPAETLVAELVLLRLDDNAIASMAKSQQDDVESVDLARQLQTDEEKLERLAVDYADDLLSRAEFMAARQRIVERIEAARAQLMPNRDQEIITRLPPGQKAIREAWEAADIDWKRAVLMAVLDHAEVMPSQTGGVFDPDRIRPHYRF